MTHLSKRLAEIKPSATLAVTAKARALQAEGIDVVGFGAGEPDFDTPEPVKEAASAALREGFTKYTPSAGIPALRAAVAAKFKEENGLGYEPSMPDGVVMLDTDNMIIIVSRCTKYPNTPREVLEIVSRVVTEGHHYTDQGGGDESNAGYAGGAI